MPTLNNGRTKGRKRSRITDGEKLLPYVHGQSAWARYAQDTFEGLLEHCGGQSYTSLPQRLTARRLAALEAEATFLEDRIGQAHEAGEQPPTSVIDLYLRVVGVHRRACEALGWRPEQRDITPDLRSYIEGKSKEVPGGPRVRPAGCSASEADTGFRNTPDSGFQNPPESETSDSPILEISESEVVE